MPIGEYNAPPPTGFTVVTESGPPMYCGGCGAAIPSDVRFCSECGARVTPGFVPHRANQAAPGAPVPQVNSPTPTTQFLRASGLSESLASKAPMVILAASAAICVGSVGPWVTTVFASRSGVHDDGFGTLIMGAGAALIAGLGLHSWGRSKATIVAVLVGLSFLTGVYDWWQVAHADPGPFDIEFEPGWGLILTTLSAGLATITALVSRRSHQGREFAAVPPIF